MNRISTRNTHVPALRGLTLEFSCGAAALDLWTLRRVAPPRQLQRNVRPCRTSAVDFLVLTAEADLASTVRKEEHGLAEMLQTNENHRIRFELFIVCEGQIGNQYGVRRQGSTTKPQRDVGRSIIHRIHRPRQRWSVHREEIESA